MNRLFDIDGFDIDNITPSTIDKTDRFSQPPKARQTMTERESRVVNEMLDMIFRPNHAETTESDSPTSANEAEAETEVEEIGVGPEQVEDLLTRLRRLTKPYRRPHVSPVMLQKFDRMKEAMSNCADDQQLLAWAEREVFDESVRYEAAAKRAIQKSIETNSVRPLPPLQAPLYPRMIAHLMHTCRVQFRDPNLAVFIFKHTQNLSIVSYVFGCSTDAYNELLETRWSSFRDLKGVHDTIMEMEVNAIPVNSKTHKLVEEIRRDLGSQNLISSESEEWKMLASIEETISRMKNKKKRTDGVSWDSWKREVLDDNDSGFDDWESLDSLNLNKQKDPFGRPSKAPRPGRGRSDDQFSLVGQPALRMY